MSGAREVRILGQKHPVKAKIIQMGGFSAHADRDGLLKWLSGFQEAPSNVFVTHGESQIALSFADLVKAKQVAGHSAPVRIRSSSLAGVLSAPVSDVDTLKLRDPEVADG